MDELTESPILVFLKSNFIVVVLALVGLGFGGIGLYQLFGPHQSSDVLIQTESISSDVKGTSDQKSTIFIDIEGAVKKPGVYELSSDKRLKDVVRMAGGLTKTANMSYVAKSLNMASKIQDGMKIYVPFEGEKMTAGSAVNAMMQSSASDAFSAGTNGGFINVNSASESELDTLPGVGPATAAKIISGRPFASIDELLSKKAVGASVFSKIKDKISAQ